VSRCSVTLPAAPDPDLKPMFIVETTWQGKRQSHSWLTCVSPSRQVAEAYSGAQSDPKASQRLFEVEGLGFPIFFISAPEGYRHVSLAALKSHLAAAEVGMPEEMLFNVYRFSGEYLWSTPGRDQTSLHMHVTSESLADYRRGRVSSRKFSLAGNRPATFTRPATSSAQRAPPHTPPESRVPEILWWTCRAHRLSAQSTRLPQPFRPRRPGNSGFA